MPLKGKRAQGGRFGGSEEAAILHSDRDVTPRGKSEALEQLRFFETALASLRESQAILQLAELDSGEVGDTADALAASLYKLIRHLRGR